MHQPWKESGWHDDVHSWIRDRLIEIGSPATGPIEEIHRRPWSIVLRTPTAGGDVYFKAPASVLFHEVALSEAVARRRPDCTLPVLAIDRERGRLLLPEGTDRLRERVAAAGDVSPWEPVLPVYASFQMDLAPHADELLALGVPDRRVSRLPVLLEELLNDEAILCVDQPERITRDEVNQVRELLPRITNLCDELAGVGIPESINHGDLHDANVFVPGGRPIFYDWSDASVTHPFFSLRTVLVSVEIGLKLEEGTAPVEPLRDPYLRPWAEEFNREHLLRAFEIAQKLWTIPSALAWARLVNSLEGEERAELSYPVPWLLKELLDIHRAK